jgi:hypothetical protein
MTKEELDAFKSAYDISVRKCIKGKDKNGKDIEEQTEWIWFDRKTLMDLLNNADEETGGIKMYLGQYDKNNINILPDKYPDRESCIGRISLALTPANKTEAGIIDVTSSGDISRTSSEIEQSYLVMNGGTICPPFCIPPPPPSE